MEHRTIKGNKQLQFTHKLEQAHKDAMELLNRIKLGDMQLSKAFSDFLDLGESIVVGSMIDDFPTIGADHRVITYKINDRLLVHLAAARARDVITGDA